MEKTLKLLVKGIVKHENNKPFEEEITFKLVPTSAQPYGNKLAMIVERPKWNETKGVDVRYARTSDINELAKMWLDDFFGDYVQSYMKIV